VIVPATDTNTRTVAKRILLDKAGVKTTDDFQALLWVNPETQEIEWCVGYDGFIGTCCQMHVVNLGGKSAPKKFLWACFDYPFNQCGLQAVTGLVNSANEKAMRFDKHLGFKEVFRLEKLHDGGGDLVVMKMDKDECKWLKLGARYETQLLAA